MGEYLSVGEAADILNVNAETLRRWDKSGKFKSSRHPINNYRVYSEDQVHSLAEELQLEIEYRRNGLRKNSTPIFQTDLGKLYKEDSLSFLSALPSNSIDLIFADPPYNLQLGAGLTSLPNLLFLSLFP